MKISFFVVLFIFVSGTVTAISAQEEPKPFNIVTPEIENPPDCDYVEITGQRAWLPFELRIKHDFTRKGSLEFEQAGNSHPTRTQTTNTLNFITTEVDEYFLTTHIDFENVKKRAVYIEYVSNGGVTHKEIIPYTTTNFCKTFFIKTSEAPSFPTVEEYYGAGLVAMIEQIPQFLPTFNQSITSITNALYFVGVAVVIMLLFGILQLITYLSRRKVDKKQKSALKTQISDVHNLQVILEKLPSDITKFFTDTNQKLDSKLELLDVLFRSLKLDVEKFVKENEIKMNKHFEKIEINEHEALVKIQMKKAELDKRQYELESILDIEDESVLRGILNQFPSEKLKRIAKLGKNDEKLNKIRSIISKVLQRRNVPVVKKETDVDNALPKYDFEKPETDEFHEDVTPEINPTAEELDDIEPDLSSSDVPSWENDYINMNYDELIAEYKKIMATPADDAHARLNFINDMIEAMKKENSDD